METSPKRGDDAGNNATSCLKAADMGSVRDRYSELPEELSPVGLYDVTNAN